MNTPINTQFDLATKAVIAILLVISFYFGSIAIYHLINYSDTLGIPKHQFGAEKSLFSVAFDSCFWILALSGIIGVILKKVWAWYVLQSILLFSILFLILEQTLLLINYIGNLEVEKLIFLIFSIMAFSHMFRLYNKHFVHNSNMKLNTKSFLIIVTGVILISLSILICYSS